MLYGLPNFSCKPYAVACRVRGIANTIRGIFRNYGVQSLGSCGFFRDICGAVALLRQRLKVQLGFGTVCRIRVKVWGDGL